MLRLLCPTLSRSTRGLLTGLIAAAMGLSGAPAFATNPPPPAAPSFHLGQKVTGLGLSTSKIVASTVVPGKDANGKSIDKRRPISFAGNGTQDVAIADLDQNQILIKQGNADGTAFTDFTVVVSPDALSTLTDMAVGDLNGDGLPDVVVCANGFVQVLINTTDRSTQTNPNHTLTFAPPVQYQANDPADGTTPLNLSAIALLSVDVAEGPGVLPDVVASMSRVDGSNFGDGFICLFRNSAASPGSLSATPSVYPFPHAADHLAVGDLDNDGYTDLVVADSSGSSGSGNGSVFVIKNVPGTGGHRTLDPSVSAPTAYISHGKNLASVAVGDIDADGNRDILALYGQDSIQNGVSVTSSNLELFHGDGTGAFTGYFNFTLQSQIPSNTGVVGNVAIGDLNVDGTTAEIVVADGLNEKVSVLTVNPYLLGLQKSFSSGSAARTTLTAGALVRAVDIGDLNKDFGMDIIVANSETTTPGDIFLNAKAGEWTTAAT